MNHNQDEPAVIRACRICLATDRRLYSIANNELQLAFEILTRMRVSEEDRLPQTVCWECAHRLLAFTRFKNKSLRSHAVLMQILHVHSCITTSHIRSVDRGLSQLESTLGQCNDGVLGHVEYVKCERDDQLITHDDSDTPKPQDAPDPFETRILDDKTLVRLKNEEFVKELSITVVKEEISPYERNLTEELGDLHNQEDDFLYDIDLNADVEDVREEVQEIQPKKKRKKEKLKKKELKKKIEEKKRKRIDAKSKIRKVKMKTEEDSRSTFKLDRSLFTFTSLTIEEQLEERDNRRETETYVQSPYKCDVCYFGFNTKDGYTFHMAKHSEKHGKHECEICRTRFKTANSLSNHFTSCHRIKISCTLCAFNTRRRKSAKAHQLFHAKIKYENPNAQNVITDRVFNEITGKFQIPRQKKERSFKVEGPVNCEQCGLVLESYKSYGIHFRREHPEMCRTKFSKMTHMCEQCGRIFGNLTHLSEHKRVQHGGERFICDICNKPFKKKGNLQCHIQKIHYGKRKMVECPQCGKFFASEPNVQRHILQLHSSLRPHGCASCGKRFATPGELRTHVGYVHLKKPYPRAARRSNKQRPRKPNHYDNYLED